MASQHNTKVFFIFFILLAFILGYGIASYRVASQLTQAQHRIDLLQTQLQQARLEIGGKADQFDARFHDLLQEHDFLLINTVRRAITQQDSFYESYKALQTNIDEVTGMIATVYGEDNAIQFKELWQKKIDNFINYTITVHDDRARANAIFTTQMKAYEEDSATYWSQLNPNINKTAFQQLITDHVNNVKIAVDSWDAQDYHNYFLKLHDSYEQIGTMADTIVSAIIKQHPELFTEK